MTDKEVRNFLRDKGLSLDDIVDGVDFARQFQGFRDLIEMWANEKNLEDEKLCRIETLRTLGDLRANCTKVRHFLG